MDALGEYLVQVTQNIAIVLLGAIALYFTLYTVASLANYIQYRKYRRNK